MIAQNASVAESKKRPSWLFMLSLIIGPASWLMAHQGAISPLLPERIAQIAPDNKIHVVMMFSSTAMFVAFMSNILLGACSDLTRTRFGKRTPWIVGCSILSCVVLVAFSFAQTIPGMLLLWCLYELVVNGVASAMIAQLSDRVPMKWRGMVSSVYGVGQMLGAQLGVLLASQFLHSVRIGIIVLALIALIGGVISAVLAGEPSNLDEPRKKGGARELLKMFVFPMCNAKNFYKVLVGRFTMIIASGMANSYMLYLIQDYLHLNKDETAHLMTINSAIMLVIGLICCIGAGPLIDRLGHLKVIVAATAAIVALGQVVPFLLPTAQGLIIFAVIVAIGNGANSALVQTLSLFSLPDPKNAAKDLGFLNLANTLGSVCASMLGAWIIDHCGYAYIFPIGALGTLLSAGFFLWVNMHDKH